MHTWIRRFLKVHQHQQSFVKSEHSETTKESQVLQFVSIHWRHFSRRLMVILAWLLTLVFTSPQAIIFRVLRHPMAEFYQCTTWGFFENFATEVSKSMEYFEWILYLVQQVRNNLGIHKSLYTKTVDTPKTYFQYHAQVFKYPLPRLRPSKL